MTESMHYREYDINAQETAKLLRVFTPRVADELPAFPVTKPSLELRRAIVLALVRHFFLDELGWPIKDVLALEIQRHSSGEPYLVYPSSVERNFKVLHISITHTGALVAFVLSDPESPSGVDLEGMSKERSYVEIAQSHFSQREQHYVEEHGELGFYYLWSAKEAVAKLQGQGLSYALGLDFGEQLSSPKECAESIVLLSEKYFRLEHIVRGEILRTIATQS